MKNKKIRLVEATRLAGEAARIQKKEALEAAISELQRMVICSSRTSTNRKRLENSRSYRLGYLRGLIEMLLVVNNYTFSQFEEEYLKRPYVRDVIRWVNENGSVMDLTGKGPQELRAYLGNLEVQDFHKLCADMRRDGLLSLVRYGRGYVWSLGPVAEKAASIHDLLRRMQNAQ